jgi:hypothetical protein
MSELKLPAIAAVVLLAAPSAHAQQDVLCSSLDKLVAAADGPSPFEKIGAEFPDGQGVATISDRLPGLDADSCVARMPASASRHGAAAGEFWEFSCTLYSASSARNEDARAEAQLYRDNMSKRVKACLSKKGWGPPPPTTSITHPPPPYGELHLINIFNPQNLPFEIVVGSDMTGITRTEQLHSAFFSFRLNGGPKPPQPLPEGVALRGRD